MAEKISFKQQCPSCDTMVPIKDMKLVGRKIDCPKCKYRFVVEGPEDADDKAEAGGAKAPKAGADKVKTGKKKGKKKSHGKDAGKLYLGLGLAVIAVGLLGVAGYFMFLSGGDSKPRPPTGPVARPGGQPPQDGSTQPGTPPVTPPVPTVVQDASNLLPNDSEFVLNVSVPDFLKSPLGETAFATPGAFPPSSLQNTLGFSERDLNRYLLAANHKQDWLFQVMQLAQPVDVEAVKKALRLVKPKDSPIQGLEYFVTESNWIEYGSPLRPTSGGKPVANPPGSRPLSVCFLSGNKVIVLADLNPMKEFLKVKGQPSLQSQPPPPPAPGAPPPPPLDPNGPPPPSNSYMTVKPALKAMLDRMEARQPVVFSLADEMPADQALLKPLVTTLGIRTAFTQQGLAALMVKDTIVCTAAMDCDKDEDAKNLKTELRPRLDPLVALGLIVNVKVQIADDQTPPPPPPPPPMPGAPPMPPSPEASATIRLAQSARSVQLNAELVPDQTSLGILYQLLGRFWIDLKGQADMATAHPGIHSLALAGVSYLDQHKQFPRGTFLRTKPGIGLPYAPDQRVSWMAELLPYLGHDDLHGSINYKSGWRDTSNLNAAFTLIPEFLAPQNPSSTWRVRYPGLDMPVAATHFVGMAGVGLDAASYSAADPTVAKKLGIFGYDRTTRLEDIKDGTSNTIFMIQIPTTHQSPWLAGGGSTIRGAQESKSVLPFICTERDGKRGTYVLMADGSVRWVSEIISDDVFQAMCTINGGKPKDLDGQAPKVPAPAGQATLRAQPTLPEAPPPKKP